MMQNQPWSVQIELTEGCNRLCTFCGLNGIRSKPGEKYRFMTFETMYRLAFDLSLLAPHARYEFAMHGEPTMNPDYLVLIEGFRRALPRAQFQITTNGIKLLGHMQERVEALFEAGIDFIVLDTYRPERDKLRREVAELLYVEVVDFYDDWAPVGKSPWHNYARKLQRTIVLMDDLEARSGEVKSRVIMNHAGSSGTAPALTEPLKKTCTLPFRELAICWDGSVNLCCMDWQAEYRAGTTEQGRSLAGIWYGPEFEAARAHLQNRDRAFGPCVLCDAGSGTRAGLLPKYGPVTAEQRVDLQRALKGSGHPDGKRRLQVLR